MCSLVEQKTARAMSITKQQLSAASQRRCTLPLDLVRPPQPIFLCLSSSDEGRGFATSIDRSQTAMLRPVKPDAGNRRA